MARLDHLETICRPVVEGMGYEFVGLEYHHNSVNALLRVYVDTPQGVNLDDIVEVSQQLSTVLDVEDPIKGHYTLEVSSPGLDRPLFSLEDFQRFVGREIQLKTRRPIEKQRNFKGVIVKVDNDKNQFTLALSEKDKPVLDMDYAWVERAKLVPDLD